MQPYRQAGRIIRCHALRQQRTDQSSQNITQAGSCHRWMAAITQRQTSIRRGDQTTGALEHYYQTQTLRQCSRRCGSIRLQHRRFDTQQTRRFTRMRRQHAMTRRTDLPSRKQIQRIGIPYLRLIATRHARQQTAAPGPLTQARPYHADIGALDQTQQLIGRGYRGTHDFWPAYQGGSNMFSARGQRHQPGTGTQRAISAQQRSAAHSQVTPNYQQVTELTLVCHWRAGGQTRQVSWIETLRHAGRPSQ